ncbi:MAG: YgfZ/GcvT domain-containing protein [Parvibaculales bacterium]
MTHPSKNNIAILKDRGILQITGADSRPFLQSLVSNDMDALTPETPLYSCLLTPQGKVLFDFFLYQIPHAILIDVSRESLPLLEKRLGFYKLRADVTITPSDMTISAIWADEPSVPAEFIFQDPRHPALGCRALNLAPDLATQTLNEYSRHRLALGICEGQNEIDPDNAFPLEYGLDQLNAIAFQKGCFIGQEVTSRAYRKGQLRKKVFPIAINGNAEIGDIIKTGDRRVGEIRAICEDQAAALIRLDALQETLTTDHANIEIKIVE